MISGLTATGAAAGDALNLGEVGAAADAGNVAAETAVGTGTTTLVLMFYGAEALADLTTLPRDCLTGGG